MTLRMTELESFLHGLLLSSSSSSSSASTFSSSSFSSFSYSSSSFFSSSSSSNNTHYFIVPVFDPSLPDDLSAHWDDLSAHWDDLRSVYPLGRFVCPGSGSYSSANVNYLFCPVSKWSSSTNWDVFTGIRLVCQMGIVC